MTREEAREILTHNWTRVDNPNYSESELDEAFFMAIEALNNSIQMSNTQQLEAENDFLKEMVKFYREQQTEYKLPGYDEIMEKLDELTLKGGDHE